LFSKKEIRSNDNGYFYLSKKAITTRKVISISFALFTICILLIASTVAFGASSTGSNNNTISGVIGNNNNNSVQKQLQQHLPKTHEYTLIAQDTTLQIAPGVRVDAWTYNGTIPSLNLSTVSILYMDISRKITLPLLLLMLFEIAILLTSSCYSNHVFALQNSLQENDNDNNITKKFNCR